VLEKISYEEEKLPILILLICKITFFGKKLGRIILIDIENLELPIVALEIL